MGAFTRHEPTHHLARSSTGSCPMAPTSQSCIRIRPDWPIKQRRRPSVAEVSTALTVEGYHRAPPRAVATPSRLRSAMAPASDRQPSRDDSSSDLPRNARTAEALALCLQLLERGTGARTDELRSYSANAAITFAINCPLGTVVSMARSNTTSSQPSRRARSIEHGEVEQRTRKAVELRNDQDGSLSLAQHVERGRWQDERDSWPKALV